MSMKSIRSSFSKVCVYDPSYANAKAALEVRIGTSLIVTDRSHEKGINCFAGAV